jgi:FkbM family methyltransferase
MRIFNTLRFIATHPLNSGRKVDSIRRYVLWQLGSRIVPGPVAIDFVNNSKLLISPGMTGATGNLYTGLHEFEDMAFVLHMLRTDDVFADVGANVGSYTILAGAVIGARCFAFEPIRQTYTCLIQNLQLNGIQTKVDAYNIGIGAEDGVLEFTTDLDTTNHVVTSHDGHGHGHVDRVDVKSLNNVFGDLNPTLIKIDVEGFETNVINGASDVLVKESLLAVIMELNGSGSRYGFDEKALHAKMLGYQFVPFSYSPFERQLIPLKNNCHSRGNTLYVRDVEEVRHRLKGAPKFFVNNRGV